VLAGDQLYAQDYGPLIEMHAARQADLTIACSHEPEGSEHVDVFIGDDSRVERIEHRPPMATAPSVSRTGATPLMPACS